MVKNRLSPISVYKLLAGTNCKKCGENSCLAFAARIVNREVPIEKCPQLLKKENEQAYKQLKALLKLPVKEVVVGVGENSVRIGGKLVLHRHEFTFFNPTAIAIDVWDEMPKEALLERVKKIEQFSFEYIGRKLNLDMIAVRSTSNSPEQFKETVETVSENTRLPLILCSLDSKVLEAGLQPVSKSRPLLHAATKDNWREMAQLSLTHNCPLVVSSSDDLNLLRSLTKTLLANHVEDLVLDPGTSSGVGLARTLDSFTMIRKAACQNDDELSGFPLMGAPLMVWLQKHTSEEIARWQEAHLAAMLIVRFADMLVMHNLNGWALLPLLVLRHNIYTDPRKPSAVSPGLRVLGHPSERSPVMFTTNFALTYHTVAADLESAKLNAYLIVVDTGGIAVDSAVAGRKLTAEKIAAAIRASGIEKKVTHRKLLIPGKAARLGNEIEKLTTWQVLVGPKDSSDIPRFLQEKWR